MKSFIAFASPTRSAFKTSEKLLAVGGSCRKGSAPALLPPPQLVQRSASFNATSTVPLKITILDEVSVGKENRRGACVKTSKSLSNCNLISKIVSKSDGTRNIISHLIPPNASSNIAIDDKSFKTLQASSSNLVVEDKFIDYYV